MSLEAALEANTTALTRVADLLELSNASRQEALAKVSEMAATEEKPKPVRGAGRPRKDASAEEAKPKEAAAPTYPDVQALRDAAVKFNGVDGDEKQRRKDFMKAVIEELGIPENDEGKRVITGAAPEDRQKVIDWFDAFAKGEKVNFGADHGAPDSDEDDIG